MPETVPNQDTDRQDLTAAHQASLPLDAEEVEPVIAPRVMRNHNESVLAARLDAEEVEPVIAPKIMRNHNESVLAARLDAEEVEPVIAPKITRNHNETVLG